MADVCLFLAVICAALKNIEDSPDVQRQHDDAAQAIYATHALLLLYSNIFILACQRLQARLDALILDSECCQRHRQ